MTRTLSIVVPVVLTCCCLHAQIASPVTLDSSQEPMLVEVGPHHRVWQRISADEHGQTITNSYTELATGMHFLDPATGQYVESQEQFEITPKGYAVASNGQHKVILAPNINSGGSVDLLTPEGKRFVSNPMGLSFFDTASGTNLLVAEVKDCIGKFIPPNVILYDDAFTDIKGAIRYTYTKAGFEQDVLIYDSSGLGSPADYGLNPETSLLEMYSEFHEAPVPEKITTIMPDGLADETLNFGQMAIGQGKAFDLNDAEESIPVSKAWQTISGRTFLIESVRYPAAEPFLERLQANGSGTQPTEKVAQRLVRDRRKLVALESMRPKTKSKEFASIQPGKATRERGFIVDYSTVNTGQTNYTFQGDMTYFITGNVSLSGIPTFEGGAVIKYDASSTPCLVVLGSVNCLANPYHPVIFTAKDDNTVGEVISGSTGSPTASSYGNYGIAIWNASGPNTIWSNLRFSYLRVAFYANRFSTHTLSHAQIVKCGWALMCHGGSDLRARNVLIDQTTAAVEQTSGTVRGENLTIHRATNLKLEPGGALPLYLTNSLLVGVTNIPATTNSFLSANSYLFTNDVPSIFQTVGAGSHYLADGTYRNIGTKNINATLLADLKQRTTYPPVLLSGDFAVSTTLSPQVQRDTDAPDLGSHYDPIDYCLSGLNLTNSTLTLTNGVAVAFYGTNGLILQSGAKLTSEGSARSPNRLVRYNSVQEQSVFWGASTNNLTMFPVAGAPTVPGELWLRFTHIPFLAGPALAQRVFDTTGGLAVFSMRDCQLQEAWLHMAPSGSGAMTAGLTNNLMERSSLFFDETAQSVTPFSVDWRNNLMFGGQLSLTHNAANAPWSVWDNLFRSMSGSYVGTTSNGYNAYYQAGQIPGSSGGDITLTNAPDFVSGTLGNYYYPTNGGILSGVVNAGSRTADLAGLYHHTVRVDQVKETNSVVDIGYHFMSVAPSRDGLVAWWRLDETAGTAAGDISGNAHSGALLNGPTWTTGPIAGALSFDGVDDYVTVNDAPDLRLSGDMTAAFWFKHNAIVTNDWGTMLAKGSGSIRNYAFFISPNTTKFEFQEYNFTAPSGQQGLFLSSVTTPTLGVWYHVAVTVQGSAIRLYVNGVLDASGTTPVPATTGTEPLTFGRSSWGGYRPYPGVVDDIRIYSRALSADEIAALTATKAYDDTDGDGIPDYLEDRNGNGLYETGDISSWATWDTDGDGMSDGQELQLGTNANLNESAQSGLRINYSYDPSGWLRQVTGARGETVGLDPEGNVQQVSP